MSAALRKFFKRIRLGSSPELLSGLKLGAMFCLSRSQRQTVSLRDALTSRLTFDCSCSLTLALSEEIGDKFVQS